MEELRTDNRLYGAKDMVKADCADCEGCCDCCQKMGTSIRLDPYDCYQLTRVTAFSFDQLLEQYIELNVAEGLIVPNIRMTKEGDCCSFLKNQRCSIHENRPGLCRLFPLGRNFAQGKLDYILLKDACTRKSHTKVKVNKWLDVKPFTEYEQFVIDWHYLVKTIRESTEAMSQEQLKTVNLYILNHFFRITYDTREDFYKQYWDRSAKAKCDLGMEEAYENQFK